MMHLKADYAYRCLRINHTHQVGNQLGKVKFFIVQRHFTAFDFRHIENIVNQGKQVFRRRVNFLKAVEHPRFVVQLELPNRAHADNRVHRRPDIVAHPGQKIRFCAVRRLSCGKRAAQKLLLPRLLIALLVKNPEKHNGNLVFPVWVLHAYDVRGNPMVFPIVPHLADLGIHLAATASEAAENCLRHKIL